MTGQHDMVQGERPRFTMQGYLESLARGDNVLEMRGGPIVDDDILALAAKIEIAVEVFKKSGGTCAKFTSAILAVVQSADLLDGDPVQQVNTFVDRYLEYNEG